MRRSRIPLSQWRPGQVLRLADPLDDIQEGWFAFLDRDVAEFRVCRLGEDETGDLCESDKVYEIHIDFAENFSPAMKIGRI